MKIKAAVLLVLAMLVSLVMPVSALTDIQLESETAVLINGDTGQILYDKNMHQQMFPASITKVMTGMLALENAKPDEVMTMSHYAVFSIGRGTSHIALDENEEITVEQAMYALAIESANDAANGLAEHVSGSTDEFANLMNEKAKECGALNTHFVNPHGLHDEEHYTTAYDMARITMAAIKTEGFNTYFGSTRYQIPPTNKQEETRYLRSSNKLLQGSYDCEGIFMSKNGWTGEAKNTLITAAERNGVTLIAVVMKSGATDIKFEDTAKLLNWGFDNYKAYTISGEDIAANAPATLDVSEGEDKVYLGAFDCPDVTVMIPSDMSSDKITFEYTDLAVSEDNTAAVTEYTILLDGKEIDGIEKGELAAPLTVEKAASAVADEIADDNGERKVSAGAIVILVVVLIIILACVLLYLRLLSIRRRNRERRMARRAERMRYR
ncbi:MAG: D-alanyl-D-alanine carboxypeptidase [Clostridia bacterium]|nr:D-alanyl-D-alanine carboxypeptidase [Clostridia bacterium]